MLRVYFFSLPFVAVLIASLVPVRTGPLATRADVAQARELPRKLRVGSEQQRTLDGMFKDQPGPPPDLARAVAQLAGDTPTYLLLTRNTQEYETLDELHLAVGDRATQALAHKPRRCFAASSCAP